MKTSTFSLDQTSLATQISNQNVQEDLTDNGDVSVQTSTFTVGKDPRIGTTQLSTPDFINIELLKNGLDNPYLELNWTLNRQDVDSGNVTGFEIYRQRVQPSDVETFFTVTQYSTSDLAKLSQKTKRAGKFGFDKKSLNNVNRNLIDSASLNTNLTVEQGIQQNKIFQNFNGTPNFNTSVDSSARIYTFEKIGTVDYTKFLAQQKNAFLYIQNNTIVNLSYKDTSVGYGDAFSYYIKTISKQLGQENSSNTISVVVQDFSPVSPPSSVIVKQTSPNETHVTSNFNSSDKPSQALFYRKSSTDINYQPIGQVDLVKNSLTVTDTGIQYKETYTYRVFVQNVHGLLSEPTEIVWFSSVQGLTSESKANTLREPVFTAVQDQNSDNINITIFPNDSLVSYYSLDRIDLTIKEKDFAVPGKNTTNYGGTGWVTNQFFVEKSMQQAQSTNTNNLLFQTTFNSISFIDTIVEVGHVYRYRLRGYDLFGNGTSYAFDIVRCEGKKSLRTPINLRSQVLREYPLRIQISWDDDNTSNNLANNASNLFSSSQIPVSTLFLLERRQINSNVYETFPLTPNTFIVDEVATSDAVDFKGQIIASAAFQSIDNLSLDTTQINTDNNLRRSYGLPNFLDLNSTYFYKITAQNAAGDRSNSTNEFQVYAVPDLSDPQNFGATVLAAKVLPVVCQLSWSNDPTRAVPDYWLLERKINTPNEDFALIGKSYLQTNFYDSNIEAGNVYVYRITGYDTLGRVSNQVQANLTI
jgi:hypothetical protein